MEFPSFNDFLHELADNGRINELTGRVYQNNELHMFIGDDNSVDIDLSLLAAKNISMTLALLEAYHQWLAEQLR